MSTRCESLPCPRQATTTVERWFGPEELATRELCSLCADVYVRDFSWTVVRPGVPAVPRICARCSNTMPAYFKLGDRPGSRTYGLWCCGVCGAYHDGASWQDGRIETSSGAKRWVGARLGLAGVHEGTTWSNLLVFAGLRLLTTMLGGRR
jgi:hypothetical protein